MQVDDIDIRILERLEADGRASLREMAEDLDLSPSTVSNRFHRLKDEGIIQGFRPVLNYEAIGFGLTAIIELQAESQQMEAVADALQGRDRIIASFEVTGESDMVLLCKFLDRQDMNERVKEFQQVDGVSSSRTKVVLDTVDESGHVNLSDALRS